jgi:hypothetical protein
MPNAARDGATLSDQWVLKESTSCLFIWNNKINQHQVDKILGIIQYLALGTQDIGGVTPEEIILLFRHLSVVYGYSRNLLESSTHCPSHIGAGSRLGLEGAWARGVYVGGAVLFEKGSSVHVGTNTGKRR